MVQNTIMNTYLYLYQWSGMNLPCHASSVLINLCHIHKVLDHFNSRQALTLYQIVYYFFPSICYEPNIYHFALFLSIFSHRWWYSARSLTEMALGWIDRTKLIECPTLPVYWKVLTISSHSFLTRCGTKIP